MAWDYMIKVGVGGGWATTQCAGQIRAKRDWRLTKEPPQ